MNDIIWFNDIQDEDYDIVGRNAFSLAELHKSGFSVPPGFVISRKVFDNFLSENGIKTAIKNILNNIDLNNKESLVNKSEEIREMISSSELSHTVLKEISENYSNLNVHLDIFKAVNNSTLNMITSGRDLPYVAIRPGLCHEDNSLVKPDALLNIRGNNNVIKAIKNCWIDMFSVDNLIDKIKKGIDPLEVGCSLIIQKQINSEKSGVIFTKPEINNNEAVIEAVFGLGNGVINNEINPDVYRVDKDNLEIKDIQVNNKGFMYTRDETIGRTKRMNVGREMAGSRVLSQNEVLSLAKLGTAIEKSYGMARDVEFALENGKAYIIKTGRLFTLKKPFKNQHTEVEKPTSEKPENSDDLFGFLDKGVNLSEEENDIEEQDDYEEEKSELTTLAFHDIEIKIPKDLKSIKKARKLLDMLEEDLDY